MVLTLPPPDSPDLQPKRLILCSTEPDAICAGLLLSRQSDLPVRRIHAPEFALTEALAHPVSLRVDRGEIALVGFAPIAEGLARLHAHLGERPGLALEVVDNHFWPESERKRIEGRTGNRPPLLNPDEAFLTALVRRTNGGDPVARRIAGLALGQAEDAEWATQWRQTLVGLWSDPGAIARETERLLSDPPEPPSDEARAMGREQERQIEELAQSAFHVFPVGREEGVLIVHPRFAAAPVREFSARLREDRGALFSLTCFDGGLYGLIESGRARFGEPAGPAPAANPLRLADHLNAAEIAGTTARAVDRSTVLVESGAEAVVGRVEPLLAVLASLPTGI